MLAQHIPLALGLAALVGCGSSHDREQDDFSGGTQLGTSATSATTGG